MAGDPPFDPAHKEDRAEIRDRIAHAANELRDQESIAATIKTEDLELAALIKSLGFDGDSARVFDLLPLVHVAWADGRIQPEERWTIMQLLKVRKIGEDSEAYRFLAALLEERPADVWLEVSESLIQRMLAGRPIRTGALVELCVDVAESAGSFFGGHQAIDPNEREALARIADTLGEEGWKAFKSRLMGPSEP